MAVRGRLHPSLLLILVPIIVTVVTVSISGWRWTTLASGPVGKNRILVSTRGSRAGTPLWTALRAIGRLGLAAPSSKAGRGNKPVVLPCCRWPFWPARIWPTGAFRFERHGDVGPCPSPIWIWWWSLASFAASWLWRHLPVSPPLFQSGLNERGVHPSVTQTGFRCRQLGNCFRPMARS